MKKLFCLLGIGLCAVILAQPALAGTPAPTGNDDPPPAQPNALHSLFLPMVQSAPQRYTVSGQVKDANDTPLSGVSVASDSGQTTLTDANGIYRLSVQAGERQISASIAGKSFDPAPAWLAVNADQHNVNFSAGAACVSPTANPSFESVFYWNPISGSAAGYTPYYSNLRANTGWWSGYTGIPVGWANRESWSAWRSHEIVIPATATSADVSLYMFPFSQESYLARGEATPDLSGLNTDAPQSPNASDGQYLIVTDVYNNWLGTLFWVRHNTQAWQFSGALSLLPWRGRTIKLEFGSYNDGYGGVTSAYFDDVNVTICAGASAGCAAPSNLLFNSDFETPDTGWTISAAALPSAYTTAQSYSPTRSMLSGKPLGMATMPGWTTSEFYQYVSIPANAASATLKMRLLPQSSDRYGYHPAQQAALDAAAKTNLPDAAESQYGYLCADGMCGPTNARTLATLFRWYPIDSAYWLYRQFDLTAYRGQSFGIVFGAQDWGDNGNTALYVDDVVLEVCLP